MKEVKGIARRGAATELRVDERPPPIRCLRDFATIEGDPRSARLVIDVRDHERTDVAREKSISSLMKPAATGADGATRRIGGQGTFASAAACETASMTPHRAPVHCTQRLPSHVLAKRNRDSRLRPRAAPPVRKRHRPGSRPA